MEKKLKDLEVKYKEKKIDSKLEARIAEVYNIETRYAIIMAINTFGSSNIKKLAKILSKNEATIYYHIKELVKKPEFLQIDNELTNSLKGIYYTLTDLARENFCDEPHEKIEDIFTKLYDVIKDKSDEEIAKFYFDLLAKNPNLEDIGQKDRRRLAYNHILENFMISNLESIADAVKKGAKPINTDYPLGSISISTIDLKISKPRQLFEILKVVSEMFSKLNQLQEKFTKEMDAESIPEDKRIPIHYHAVGGEIAEFKFE
jgi:DNA-binding MarR family transcriptional regulator